MGPKNWILKGGCNPVLAVCGCSGEYFVYFSSAKTFIFSTKLKSDACQKKSPNKYTKFMNLVHEYQCVVNMCECEISLDRCRLSLCQYCVCSQSIQSPASPISSQAHPCVCRETSHSANLAWSQCKSSG